MRRNRYSLILVLVFGWIGLMAQASLEGKVTDAETGEPILFGNVALYKNDVLITGTETDLDGNYAFSNIDPGTYDVEATYVGYQGQKKTGVVIQAGKAIKLDFEMGSGVLLETIEIIEYKVPLIEQDNTTTGGVKTSEQIRNLPTKNINALAATTAGLSSIDGGDISIRGSRTDATNYYIDGVRVSGRLIPQSEIEQMQVITGGVEAQYGDVTGGIVNLTTKGPSNNYSGGLEVETSEFLDPYGYNLVSGNFSGPIMKNREGRSVLGFRISGQYLYQEEGRPRAFGAYRAKESVLDQLEANPLLMVEGNVFSAAEYLNEEDVELMEAAPNNSLEQFDVTAKLDARINQFIDLTFSGTYTTQEDYFTPGVNGRYLGNDGVWSLLNWRNNPISNDYRYRGNFRLRHRLGGSSLPGIGEEEERRSSTIRNLSYTLQFGYQKAFAESYDINHEDRFFDYGYVGHFDVEWVPQIGESDLPSPVDGVAHAGYAQQLKGWTPGAQNPVLARYNAFQGDVQSLNQFNAYNSFLSDNYNSTWFGIHANVGNIFNQYNKNESERYTGSLTASFDLYSGSSDKGRHNVQFGILYEQRVSRSWTLLPFGLWNLARQRANSHILGLDTSVIVGTFIDSTTFNEPVEFNQYGVDVDEAAIDDPNLLFFKNIRQMTGQSYTDYVNIDGISPDQLSIDLFAPQELNDQQIIGYYGYDYLGNKLTNDVSFDDFFHVDDAGYRRFDVAPTNPIYAAAYIQDKFTFKDIIFRVGLRVDMYDANTKVLKDPLSLYEVMGAADFYDGPGLEEVRPPNVDDDWKIYVESEGSETVRAFRDGDQWYFSNGSPANDGNVIFGSELAIPYYVEQDNSERNIKSLSFDPSTSFEDYTTQFNWMPRLAFSFPISDEANFFAHYDILVQRPPSNTIATALNYYYFEDGPPANNPDLKPEKTIDLELGFKQKISNSSAITLSAYYKEMRDMIQRRTYLYVPPPVNSYDTYGNLDFGTVKGFSVSYDLRRTNNLEMTASYTLQFADGTGSDANSQRGLTTRGNIRTLFPLDFDERHRFVANIDYRYGAGKAYTGPRIAGADVFANTGIGMQLTTVSGRPYTRRQKPEAYGGTGILGALNGARYPWNFTVDLRANKEFRLMSSEEGKSPVYVNVYLRVQNLFDTKNVINVYSASGSAEDDGFLTTAEGQASIENVIESGRQVEAFLTSYQWRLLNAGFYTFPRRVYLGAIVEF